MKYEREIPEKSIQNGILEYLAVVGIVAKRNNSGFIHLENREGKKRGINIGEAGWPDIIGSIPPNGRFLGIEVKRVGKAPTELQKMKLEELRKSGALVGVCSSIDDVIELLKEAK